MDRPDSIELIPVDQRPASTGSFSTEDPSEHEQASRPWDLVISDVSAGAYGHRVSYLLTPGLTLYRESMQARMRIRGMSPPGTLTVAVPVHPGSDTRYWGKPLYESGLPASLPDGTDAHVSAGQRHLLALVDLDTFRELLPRTLAASIEMAARHHVLPASSQARLHLGATLDVLLRDVGRNPALLDHAHAVRAMQMDVLSALARSLSLPGPSFGWVEPSIRQRGFRRVVDYLHAADRALVTVAELCAVANVSERTLEYAFHENMGLSPQRFLNLRRFHAARKTLLGADAATTSVQEIAYDNGFYQLGRFAVSYRNLFGESPSATLTKPPRRLRSCLCGGVWLDWRSSR